MFLQEKIGILAHNNFFLEKSCISDRNPTFIRENQKKIFWKTIRPSCKKAVHLVFPRKKLLFLLFPTKKLLLQPKTILFLGKKVGFWPQIVFVLGNSWFFLLKPIFARGKPKRASFWSLAYSFPKMFLFFWCFPRFFV